MPPDRYAHLELSRLIPTRPRRRGGGGGPSVEKKENPRQHGEMLGRQLENAEEALTSTKPSQFDPGLLMKLRIQPGTITEEALRSFGIDIVSEETDETLVVFFDEVAKQEFLARLSRYEEGASGRGVSANVFHAIEEVGTWGRHDRIGRTLKNKTWSEEENIVVDIELWPRESHQKNRSECDQTKAWLQEQGAEIWDDLATDSVSLIRTQLTGRMLDTLLELETIRIVDLPPKIYLETADYDLELHDVTVEGPQDGEEVTIAVLDSGVISGHPMLAPAMAEEISFIPGVNVEDETGHGTAVGGFALYGDIERCVRDQHFATPLRLLSGKVLSGDRDEYDRRLIASQVIDAVNYFHGNLGCRIFNISFADREQPYNGQHVKGLATVLDELARKHDILFVVSAGNFSGTDDVPGDWRRDYPEYLFSQEAKIIDPAPALNAVTVGSLARYDVSTNAARYPRDANHQSIARINELSPFTRTGPGPNGAIKPDLVEYGGNMAVDLRGGGVLSRDRNLGEISLKHSFVADRLFLPMIGTSFATPKISYIAGQLLTRYPDASTNLIRALLLLNAKLPNEAETLIDGRTIETPLGPLSAKEASLFSYGYGLPQDDPTLYSRENCVTLTAEETIEADQTHFYEIPLPEAFLSRGRCQRNIRVSLAYSALCRSTRKKYKGSKIYFKVVLEDDVDQLVSRFQHGSDLENIPEWSDLSPGSQIRSKGTAMAATRNLAVIGSNSPLLNGKRLFVVVTHQVEGWASELIGEEPYALAVAIEDASEEVRLYTQLRTRLRQRARARV